jgi:DNA-binding transcriptional LysR family regulator
VPEHERPSRTVPSPRRRQIPGARRPLPAELNLDYLHEVAALGSMRAAADGLGVAVSSISRQIAQLERQLGITLLERGRRAAKLTEAGHAMMEYYRDRQAQRERLEQRLDEIRGSRAGRVTVAIGEGFIGDLLATMLQGFVAKYPELTVDVRMTASSNEAARLVAEDEAHVGLAFQALQRARVRTLGSVRQSLCVVVPAAHPLAAAKSVALKQLEPYRLCLPEATFRTRQLLRAVEVAENCSLRPSITSNSINLLKSLVRSGEFVTLVPELAVHEELERGEFVTLPLATDLLPDTGIHVLSRSGRQLSPAAQTLAKALTEFLQGCGARIERARRRPGRR